MRLLCYLAMALGVLICGANAQPFPSPTLAAATVTGNVSTGSLTVTGTSNLNGGGALKGTFAGPTVLSATTPSLTNVTLGTLPASPTPGTMVYVTDCLNGTQTLGFGTGCLYFANDNGTWTSLASPSNLSMIIGGQTIFLGGATLNQGNGNRIQLSAGTPVSGHCAQFDANSNITDAGAGCGGAGGSGTVSSGTAQQIGFYAANGTTISGLTAVASGVPSYNSGGTLGVSTTLPSGLTIPGATISNPAITGSATAATLSLSGKLTAGASTTVGASLNCPQGTAPNSPANGDVWCTSSGIFARFNGATKGPLIDLTALSATSPVSYNSGTGAFSCPTCLTASGGALAASAPIALSGNTLSLNELTIPVAVFIWNATTPVTNDSYLFYWAHATGHITSVKYYTAGASTPSFTVGLQVNGTNVAGCNAISVTSSNTQASPGSTTCTSTAITTGQSFSVSTSAVAGSPSSALVEVLGTASGT